MTETVNGDSVRSTWMIQTCGITVHRIASASSHAASATDSSSETASDTVVVPRFYESVKPWDSITIPALSCPDGSYLVDEHLSPGRLVPKGVEVQLPIQLFQHAIDGESFLFPHTLVVAEPNSRVVVV